MANTIDHDVLVDFFSLPSDKPDPTPKGLLELRNIARRSGWRLEMKVVEQRDGSGEEQFWMTLYRHDFLVGEEGEKHIWRTLMGVQLGMMDVINGVGVPKDVLANR